MAVKAVFVGVNKHQDAGIPELSGARPDATALWALFTDTLPGLRARLLLDERATHAEASEVIFGTLANADREDVVVVTFSVTALRTAIWCCSIRIRRTSLERRPQSLLL